MYILCIVVLAFSNFNPAAISDVIASLEALNKMKIEQSIPTVHNPNISIIFFLRQKPRS